MPKLPEFLQQIVNEACDEKSLPSGQCIDKAELTMLCPFLYPSDLNKILHSQLKKKPQKTMPLKNPNQKNPPKPTQKCLEMPNKSWNTEMSSLKKKTEGRSPGKVFKIFRTFKKLPVFQFSESPPARAAPT